MAGAEAGGRAKSDMSEPSEMMLRIAREQEGVTLAPVESGGELPRLSGVEIAQSEHPISGVPYDPGLQVDLEEFGPDAMQEYGQIVVRDTQREERFNSAVWYAHAHDLAWTNRPDLGCVIITWHEGKEPHDLRGGKSE